MLQKINLIIAFIAIFTFAAQSQTQIEWMDFEEVMEKQEENTKKVIIKIYSDGCRWCKRMDEETFNDPGISNFVNDNFYAVEMNAAYREDITFQDKTYQFVKSGKQNYHEFIATLMKGDIGYPAVIFMDENMDVIQCVSGFKAPDLLHQIMGYFAHNYHKKMPWSEYKKMPQEFTKN